MADILIVDDDQSVASAFERVLRHDGHGCTLASSADDALRRLADHQPDLMMMDIRMPGLNGLEALQQVRSRYPGLHVVMMTAYGTSQTSIDAIRAGAFDYLMKPVDLDQLRDVIRQAIAAKESRARRASGADYASQPAVDLVGSTPAMLEVYKLIGRLAAADVPALVIGERGTGKELVIATIHHNSARRDEPFTTIDCATLTEGTIEAEIFVAARGTLHLAHVDLLPRALQLRLARALVAGPARVAKDNLPARIIASAERALQDLVEAGSFSRELHEALALVTLRLPPLRDRPQDIPLLVRHVVQRMNAELDRTILGVDDTVLGHFLQYPWPGNIGQLEALVKRACIITRSDVITFDLVADGLSDTRLPGRREVESDLCRAVRLALEERIVERHVDEPSSVFHAIVGLVETTLVREALQITNGNQVKASELLGVNRATLRKKVAGE